MKRLQAVGFVALACFAAQSAFGDDGKADLAGAGAPQVTLEGNTAAVTELAWSPDGRRVAAFDQNGVHIWEAASSQEISSFKVNHADAAAFSKDLSSVAIARFDKPALREKVMLHDTRDGHETLGVIPYVDWEPRFPYMFRPLTAALAFSADGRRLAAAGSTVKPGGPHGLPGGVVTFWNVETGKELWRFDHLSTIAAAIAFSPDGKYVAAGAWGAPSELPEPGQAAVWNTETGELLHSFRVKAAIDWNESLYSIADVAFDPTSTRLATAVSDGTVRLWELSSGRTIMTLPAHRGEPIDISDPTGWIAVPDKVVRCVAFSPDGSRLAAAGYERVVRIWNAETGEETDAFRFDVPWIGDLAFSPDGRQLAAGGGTTQSGVVVIWQLVSE